MFRQRSSSARPGLERTGEPGPPPAQARSGPYPRLSLAGGGSSYGAAARRLQARIDAGKFSVLSDPPAFQKALDQAVRDYTRGLV